MKRRRVVLDTNVFVAALRSRRGASFYLLHLLAEDWFEVAISIPLLFEYEEVLTRQLDQGLWTKEDIEDLLSFVCKVGYRQSIFFLWRPCLPDPKDDMVLELAFAAGCEAIVTHNRKDFEGAERLGIRVNTPVEFLHLLKELT